MLLYRIRVDAFVELHTAFFYKDIAGFGAEELGETQFVFVSDRHLDSLVKEWEKLNKELVADYIVDNSTDIEKITKRLDVFNKDKKVFIDKVYSLAVKINDFELN